MSKKFSAVSIVLVLFLLVVGVLTYLMGPALWASRDNSFRTLTPSEVELEKVEKQDGAEFNFRTSLVIETPDGLVEGSVVRTATMRYSPRASGNGGTFSALVKGEALAMEISPGKWLFGPVEIPPIPPEYYEGTRSLSVSNKEEAEKALVFYNSAPEGLGRDIVINPQTVYDRIPLGADWSVKAEINERNKELAQKAPRETFAGLLVTFSDINDPTTVELVDLADLEATFGEGVKFVSGRYEYTKAPRTEGVVTADWWPWLNESKPITLHIPSKTIGLQDVRILNRFLFDTEILRKDK